MIIVQIYLWVVNKFSKIAFDNFMKILINFEDAQGFKDKTQHYLLSFNLKVF